VDLLAEFDSSRRFSLLDMVGLENRLADILGVAVDLTPARALTGAIRGRATSEARSRG
jgi:predicted nucleotidyltransferase